MTASTAGPSRGLSLQPFRALRPVAEGRALARLLCPPYDVIDAAQRATLLAADPDNAVSVILPDEADGDARYEVAARRLAGWVTDGHTVVDPEAALYVYEMRADDASATRGLVGAVELRDPRDGVILPHENTMSGPVADRLALMRATEADLEPIYLVYDGGGAASDIVASVDDREPIATATTADSVTHRLWAITDPRQLAAIAQDLDTRRALIADGHHRYATYRELQRELRATRGAGPWDQGLTLLVDSSSYGPQVHAIHRVVRLSWAQAIDPLAGWGIEQTSVSSPVDALAQLGDGTAFTAVLTDGMHSAVITDAAGKVRAASNHEGETATLTDLDVIMLHRGLVGAVWALQDTVDTVGYAHSPEETIEAARAQGGVAVLLRATPVGAVAAVAAAGARMPRKSTLFTPKPASGLLMRRFADADPGAPS